MAITGTFAADFTQFEASTRSAEASLAKLEGQGMKLGTTFTSTQSNADRLRGSLNQFDGVLSSLGVNLNSEIRAITELGQAAGKSGEELGLIATAGLVVGAGVAGWKIGRAVADFFDLDKTIGNATATLLGWGDVAGESAAAKQDVLALATARAGRSITDFSEALQINQKWVEDHKAAAAAAAKTATEYADAWERVNARLAIGKPSLEGVSKATLGLVADMLEANASIADIAITTGLTIDQVKVFIDREHDRAAASKKASEESLQALKAYDAFLVHMDKETFALAQEHEKQWRAERLKALGLTNAAVLAEFDAQTKLNAAAGLDASGAITLQTTAADTLRLSLEALHHEQVTGIAQTKEEQVLIDAYTASLYNEARAQDAVTQAAMRALTLPGINQTERGPGVNVEGPGSAIRGPGINSIFSGPNFNPSFSLPGFKLPTKEEGGPTGAGGPMLLHPDEYVVPRKGALVLRGGGSGVTFAPGSVVITINGSNPDVARKVSADIVTQIQRALQLV